MRKERSARLGATLALLACAACSPKAKPNDVMGRARPTEELDAGAIVPVAPSARGTASQAAAGLKPRVVAKASSRALALDAKRIFFGDGFEDTVVCIAKEGGPIQRIARRSPVAGGLAIDGDAIAWVATPGDVVLRASIGAALAAAGASADGSAGIDGGAGSLDGGAAFDGRRGDGGSSTSTSPTTSHGPTPFLAPAVVREHGLFSDVAAQGGDMFIAEAQGGGGTITRVDAHGSSTKLTSIDGAPRALALDATHVYIVTAQKVLRVPRARGELDTVTIGADFQSPVVDGDMIYVVAATSTAGAHRVVRVKKTGGATETVAASVRAAPIAVDSGELFYFDPQRSRLLAQPLAGGPSRILAQDDALSRPNAIAVDANAVYVATGEREDGMILAVQRK